MNGIGKISEHLQCAPRQIKPLTRHPEMPLNSITFPRFCRVKEKRNFPPPFCVFHHYPFIFASFSSFLQLNTSETSSQREANITDGKREKPRRKARLMKRSEHTLSCEKCRGKFGLCRGVKMCVKQETEKDFKASWHTICFGAIIKSHSPVCCFTIVQQKKKKSF